MIKNYRADKASIARVLVVHATTFVCRSDHTRELGYQLCLPGFLGYCFFQAASFLDAQLSLSLSALYQSDACLPAYILCLLILSSTA